MFSHESRFRAGATAPLHIFNFTTTAWVLLALVLLMPLPIRAQATGAIVGTVTDPSGAVIPNAKITATRVDTGVSQSTVTTGAGTYTISNLVVGTYNVTAEGGGFKTGSATGITLDVSQRREVNFTLSVVGVESTVEVTAAPPLITTTDATIGGLVSEEQVQTLPLNGRNITGLVMMQPGMAQDTGSMGWMAPAGQWIANGNRGETMIGTLDNADISDAEMGTLQFTNFNLDAIAEFKILQNNYSAQYGQGGGTITQMVSKTGTNGFHGSAFEFVRNSAFDARNFFATSVPPFKRNEFGATFGGPIKKDKTFFFAEYAGLRQRLGEPNIVAVPTAAEKTGQVPVTLSNGSVDQLQVPLNPVASQILAKYPLPNQPNGVFGANTYNFMFSQPTNDDQFSARVDHHFANDTLFVRTSYANHNALETDAWAGVLGGSKFSTANIGDARNYAISDTHLFSPTLLNVFTFTLNRGIEGVPEAPAEQNTTATSFLDGSLQGWGPDTFETKYVVTMFDYKDNVSWTRGRHSFNIGGQFRREWDNGTGVTSIGPSGIFYFNSGTPLTAAIQSINGGPSFAAGSPSPSGLISMMEGDDVNYGRATTVPGYGPPGGGEVWWGLRRWTLAGYLQDDFRVTRRLTLNLGLRYEYASVPTEVGNRFAGPADYGKLYGHFVVNPQPLWKPDYLAGDFGPRFGMALNLGKNTVLRGGLALFTNMIPTVYPDQALVNFPVASLNYLANAPYSLTPQAVSLPVLTSITGQPIAANGSSKSIPPNTPVNLAPYAAILGAVAGDYPSDGLRNGYTISGNVTLEHEFPGSVAVQASYIANNGVALYNQTYPNAFSGALPQFTPYSQVTPGLGELQVFYNGAHSTYNALQVQARKISVSHGLQFQANYTFAKNMTDADAVWSSGGQSGGISQNNPQCVRCERAPASYSIAQRFVANFEYDIPLGNWSALPKRLSQGWMLLGIFSAQSGFPFTVVAPYGSLQYGYDIFDGFGARPFLLQKPTLHHGGGPQFFSDAVNANGGIGDGFFDVPTVTSPVNGNAVLPTPGNLGRNTFTGPGWSNLDFSLVKDTKITETKKLQFRAEFFNILNHATFGTPGATLGSQSFGISTGTATTERQIQFGLRLMF
ncbi:MAG TPA: TonB-dependent receptor [Terriglobales bacterium]|nr:TonB-dependent receptor [Terriglobales bacterium]